jgi:hypothetical protein
MAALESSDVSVSATAQNRWRSGPKTFALADVTFGDATKTYPAGGVPLPAKQHFGMKKEIQMAMVEGASGNGYVYKYDRANHKLKIFNQGVTTGETAAAACENGALAIDENGAETVARISGTAASTTYNLGALKEVGALFAPAEQTIRILFIGE